MTMMVRDEVTQVKHCLESVKSSPHDDNQNLLYKVFFCLWILRCDVISCCWLQEEESSLPEENTIPNNQLESKDEMHEWWLFKRERWADVMDDLESFDYSDGSWWS